MIQPTRTIFSAAALFLLVGSASAGARGRVGQQRAGEGGGGEKNANPRRGGRPIGATEELGGGGGGGNRQNRMNNMGGGMGGGMNTGRSQDDDEPIIPEDCYNVRVKVTNLALGQPFSEFYVHAHNEIAIPLYTLGEPASIGLKVLAEDGNAREMVNFYEDNILGVYPESIRIEGGSQPIFFGESLSFVVSVDPAYPYISFASMAINTNDVFIGVAGMKVDPGSRMTIFVPGYDAGTEENNELCDYIPGPACGSNPINLGSFFGEGLVYISKGIAGVGIDDNRTQTDLNPALYDWRNPMARVEVIADLPGEEVTH